MNTLLLASLLTATTVAHVSHDTNNEKIKYQIVINEDGYAYDYSYVGTKIKETRQYLIYNMNMEACNKQNAFYTDVIDSRVFTSRWNSNSNFSFKKDIINYRCFLTIRKSPRWNNRHYNNVMSIHHNNNHRRVIARHNDRHKRVITRHNDRRTRVIIRNKQNNNRTRVVVRPHSNSRVIVRDRGNNGTRVIIKPRVYKKHLKNVNNFHKKNKKHKKGHVKIKKYNKMYY